MNRYVRYLSLYIFMSILYTLQAGQLVPGRSFRTFGALVRFSRAVADLPLIISSELVIKPFILKRTGVTQPKPIRPQEEILPSQAIVSHQSNIHAHGHVTTGQITEVIDIPQILQTVVAELPENPQAPMYINLNVSNQQTATSTAKKHIPATIEPISSTISNPKPVRWHQSVKEQIKRTTAWISSHKIRSAIGATLISMTALHGYVWYLNRTLCTQDCWSTWRAHCSLTDLHKMSQKELINNLLKDLAQTYDNDNPVENTKRYIKQTYKELRQLKHYQSISAFSRMWPLKYLFFSSMSLIETIPDRITRLTFLKNTMEGWLKNRQEIYSYENLFSSSQPEGKTA